MKTEFIADEICPFCQRVEIILRDAGIPFELTATSFTEKPPWLFELTPLGKVPVLRLPEGTLFESAAIVAYLDERSGHHYSQGNAFERARDHAWCAVVEDVHRSVRLYIGAQHEVEFQEALESTRRGLLNLEAACPRATRRGRLHFLGVFLAPLLHLCRTLSMGPHRLLPARGALVDLSHELSSFPAIAAIDTPTRRRRLWHFLLSARTHLADIVDREGLTHSLIRAPLPKKDPGAAAHLDDPP